jgi:hypothetical protein
MFPQLKEVLFLMKSGSIKAEKIAVDGSASDYENGFWRWWMMW